MILKIRNGIIYSDEGEIIGTLVGDNAEAERVIELGSEAVPAIENFVEMVNSGSFKPRTAVKTFEAILEKHAI